MGTYHGLRRKHVDTYLNEFVFRYNRTWPEALKREIVAASLEPGSVSVVARHYDVNANQVFAWRKHYRAEASAPAPLQLCP